MNTTNLFSTAKATVARLLIGGDVIADTRNDLLKQVLVAVANKTSSGGGAVWGVITGTLSNQTDLVTALNLRLLAASNLSDLTNAGAARTNLGLGTLATQAASAVAITGGTLGGLTGLGIRSTGAAFDLTLASSEVLTAGRTLSFNVGNAARTLTLSGNPSLSGVTITGGGTIATGGFTLTVPATGTAALLGTAQNFSAANVFSVNGGASAPALSLTGAMFSGGSATTTKPLSLIEPAGTTSTGWSTNGTLFGINSPTGTTSWRYLDCLLDGVSKAYIRKDGMIHSEFGIEANAFYNSGGGIIGSAASLAGVNGFFVNSLQCSGPIGIPGSQALSGAGAINLTTTITKFTSTGASQALTLADGADGQIKIVEHVSAGGTGILTPTTKTGYTSVTFTNAGDTVTLMFNATVGWFVLASRGVTIA